VRGLVVDAERRVFLVKHSYVAGWHLPGGGVEPGETLAAALARELREEGNIELTAPAVLFAVYFNRRISRRDHVALYVARSFRQSAPPRLLRCRRAARGRDRRDPTAHRRGFCRARRCRVLVMAGDGITAVSVSDLDVIF
jgi:8-oxo-dGTP pyrophosphatase MutT (NUDIX family)